MNHTVSIQNLSHRYGKIQVLDDVSLNIPQGATVGLIGSDGVGKSTLLSLIAGVRKIQTGTVNVFGSNIADKTNRQKWLRRIAYVPQGLGKNLYPTLTVYENIEFHARMFGSNVTEYKQRITRLLDTTGLTPFSNRMVGQLSSGMKQKLSLCCALVHNPDLLILDEPTTGLDPLSRRQFWKLVNKLRQEIPNMTVIVATAHIDEAEQFEQLLVMDTGKLLIHAPTQEIMARFGVSTLEQTYLTPFTPQPNTPPVIEAHGLTKQFGNFKAVDHVDFKIEKGEIFGFIGSNGCGKSTMMKMLMGLLDATSGTAELFGEPIDSGSLKTKKRVGYMSQAFSLYEELTVRQNLNLHAKLYDVTDPNQAVERSLQDFDLVDVANVKPALLPLGIRQRLQLAAACLHQPEILILDEPTSGVDVATREMFWRKLWQLSRENRITILVSTHFMNEVEYCDRISLMHHGRVLAMGTPAELLGQSGQPNIEEAFIHYLKIEEQNKRSECSGCLNAYEYADNMPMMVGDDVHFADGQTGKIVALLPQRKFANCEVEKNFKRVSQGIVIETYDADWIHLRDDTQIASVEFISRVGAVRKVSGSLKEQSAPQHVNSDSLIDWLMMVYAFAIRETKELLRDKIRLFFVAFVPAILLVCLGWVTAFDVSDLHFTVLDRDQSPESRQLVARFASSPNFIQQPNWRSDSVVDIMIRNDQAKLLVDIPPNFGQKLLSGQQPEIGFIVDGAVPFNATNVSGYAQAILGEYNMSLLAQQGFRLPENPRIVPRLMYSQDFKSVNMIVFGMMMLVLMMIPCVMSALAVVRERETGTIQNLYASPASAPQYLLGKQLPYILMGVFNLALLMAIAVFWFGIPIKGSFLAIMLGGVLLVCAATALGLLISALTKSQTAAFFVGVLASVVPTVNFSGWVYPMATLSGEAYAISVSFPASYFGTISKGGLSKGLGFSSFLIEYAMLLFFFGLYLTLACIFLHKQEK